jgi:chromosome segregation ATPase
VTLAQTAQERQAATIVRLERELEEARHKLDECKAEVQAVQNSHRGEIKKMQDLLKMMQEQLEALQANRSGPAPTKVGMLGDTSALACLACAPFGMFSDDN